MKEDQYTVPHLFSSLQFTPITPAEAREVLNWQMASAVAVLLVAAAVIAAMLLSKVKGGASLLAEEGR